MTPPTHRSYDRPPQKPTTARINKYHILPSEATQELMDIDTVNKTANDEHPRQAPRLVDPDYTPPKGTDIIRCTVCGEQFTVSPGNPFMITKCVKCGLTGGWD